MPTPAAEKGYVGVQVRAMLIEGQLTYGQIARRVDLSRRRVEKIAAELFAEKDSQEVPPYHCPTCERRVTFKPCRICATITASGPSTIPDSTLTEQQQRENDTRAAQLSGDLTPAKIEARAAEVRKLPRSQAGDQPPRLRRRVFREEVESRLELQHRILCEQIAGIRKQSPPAVAAALRRLVAWLESDRERFIADLFRRTLNPGRDRDSEREPVKTAAMGKLP